MIIFIFSSSRTSTSRPALLFVRSSDSRCSCCRLLILIGLLARLQPKLRVDVGAQVDMPHPKAGHHSQQRKRHGHEPHHPQCKPVDLDHLVVDRRRQIGGDGAGGRSVGVAVHQARAYPGFRDDGRVGVELRIEDDRRCRHAPDEAERA
ncbi:hypothetical protein T310_8392 [Rasamsonia emersonii CBS 393.64]|uniref:Uncharacterized protein n=1 Tax=Rasamsonia emersonii (strain ATCC 16479 / CBS 393.64 / IMI 116815) TaxID=1408163 RepID=A0A0F4YHU2_RASE3|nr:hypothetical protein T310_8392 [Rasamsonia emersonii CBS 393.64]KKA17665.1 hypothetical protein T310_8392 [Rasamsonia emersonii CBS 393.64]